MNQLGLFTSALGLSDPWKVVRVDFDAAGRRLDLAVDFERGARFGCPEPECAQRRCRVHDTESKSWRHLDFFQHQAYLSARVPRVRCPVHGVRQVAVAWARPQSGFTLLFEALLLQFCAAMPVARVARMVGEQDTRVWRVLERYVHQARAGQDFSQVTQVGMDETSARRGHDYVTIFMDLLQRRVLFATEGKDAATVQAFAADVRAHNGDPAQIVEVCSDMSPAFISGIGKHLPDAQVTFDRFHVVAKLGEAIDAVRRAEQRGQPALKRTRYLWLKGDGKLTAAQRADLAWLTRPSSQLATARAWRWRQDFDGFYDQTDPVTAQAYLRRWCYGAKRSRLQPIKNFVTMVEAHFDGITRWHHSKIANGLLEGTNSLIQAAKAKARGYRNKQKMITIIYLIAGKLPLPTTHTN